jgi:hypothetical protein
VTPHGTLTRYAHHGCRCQACRQANSTYHAAWVDRQRGPLPLHVQHGTHATYTNYQCRCRGCIEAHAAYMRAYKRRRREQAGAT